jgi:hypothetical protein
MKACSIFLAFLLTTVWLVGCGGPEVIDQSVRQQSREPSGGSPSSPSPPEAEADRLRQHPCVYISAGTLASTFGLVADSIRLEKQDVGNSRMCLYTTTELNEGEEESILSISILTSDNEKVDFAQGLENILQDGTISFPAGPDKGEVFPVTEVEDLGGPAFTYATPHLVGLSFVRGPSQRVGMFTYRKVPGNRGFQAFEEAPEVLARRLVELARKMP